MKIGSKENMEELLNDGSIFLQRWRNYQKIEQVERGDKNEGLSHSFQPENITLKINGKNIEDIIGPIRLDDGGINPFIYCMYGFNSTHASCKQGQLVDSRCESFGDTAVIIKDGIQFFERLKKACENVVNSFEGKLIQYVDFETYHGEMGCFKKYKDYFSHQHEFRIVFGDIVANKTFKIKIGTIQDIAELYPLGEINNIVKIKF